MDFPGICDKCPLGLVCATSTAYEEKNLCHCRECKQVLMVFRETGRETIRKILTKAGRQTRRWSLSKQVFNILYGKGIGDVLIGLLGNWSCPHPYTGPDYLCPACARELKRRQIEGDEEDD